MTRYISIQQERKWELMKLIDISHILNIKTPFIQVITNYL
jgi:hypothetical protein